MKEETQMTRLSRWFCVLNLVVLCVSSVLAHETEKDIKVEVLAKSEKAWDGSSLPDFSAAQTEVTVLRITIAPKAVLPKHKHPIINAGYMVEGHLTVHTEVPGEILKLKPGDAIIELVDKWHYGVNETDKPVVIVVMYVGPAGSVLSVKKDAETGSKK